MSDARPEEIFRVAGPSIWPFVAACGAVAIFAAELVKLRWGAVLGLGVIVVGVIGWNWPNPAPITEDEEEAFEKEHQIPVHVGGSMAIARWGMGLVVTFIGIALASFLLAYFYLRLENPVWPPPGIPVPGLILPVVATVLVAAGGLTMLHARGRIENGDPVGLRTALIAATLLATSGVVIQVFDFGRLPFDSMVHAYGSVYFVVGWFAITVAVGGVVMAIMTVYWAFHGHYTARRHVPVSNVATYWLAMTVVWVLGQGVIHLTPHLT
jgi:cytochrome c oxidase subunit I+III